jgi:hypothetical protein
MSAALRHNARMDRIFNNAIQAKKDDLALLEAKARFPAPDTPPIERDLAQVEWQIHSIVGRREHVVTTHPDYALLTKQLEDRMAKRTELQKQRDWYSNENQRKVHYESIQYVVKPEARGPRYEAVNRAFPLTPQHSEPLPGHTAAMEKLNPYYGLDRKLTRRLKTLAAAERREDEHIQYGNRKARLEKVQAQIRKAKRATAGIKKFNPFIAKGIKRNGPAH